MENVFRDAARSVLRTVAGTFTFDGRARVVDVGYYWLAAMFARLLIDIPAGLLPWDAEWFVDGAADILVLLPLFALFARRLHDQGNTGWWALVLLPLPAINLYQSYRAVFAVRNPAWLQEASLVDPWAPLLFAVILAVLVFLLRPGTRGHNRFGPDPREPAAV